MSFNFGSSSGKGSTNVNIPPPTNTETELQGVNIQLAQAQLDQMRQQIAEQAAFKASPLGQMQSQLEEAATKNLLARATGEAPILTSAQQASLDQLFGRTEQQSMEALTRFAQEQAQMRGMTTADSPIGAEALRQAKDLQTGLAATKTQAALNLGQSSDLFNQNLQNFQSQLRQQAFQNRLALSTSQPASFGLQNMLLAQRLPFQSTTSRGSQSGYGLGASGQQAGGLLQGLSAYGG